MNTATDFSTNYFDLLGLPVSFDVDTDALEKNYRSLQQIVHPDKYAGASERERRIAMQQASHVNEALQVLKNPLRRGQYLLSLQGWESGDNHTETDPEMLMEQMELREELEALKYSDNPFGELDRFMAKTEASLDALIARLSTEFAANDYQNAQRGLRKLQFFLKLQEEALMLEEDLV